MTWQPIKTIPAHVGVCLGYGDIEGEVGGEWSEPQIVVMERDNYGWGAAVTDYYAVTVKPTHWMPLPDPPEAA